MFKNLSPGAIGIRGCSLSDSIELARRAGFEGIDFSIREAAALADEHGIDGVRGLFENAGILPGQWGLPVAWNRDDQWEKDLEGLPKLAALGRALGCTRTATWCPPSSDEREYEENFAWHAARFRPIAEVLKEYDCRLGIEFIGPKTSRDRGKYEFIYTLEGMMELAAAIGTGNVGLLLDAWHLYTSGGSIDDLDKVTADDVVVVHVNDAPAGIARDEQIDNVRRLPMETGVIDLPGFMGKLDEMGYDGPITPEPFSERINAIEDPLEAAQLAANCMDRMWRASGLA
ncbi:MAG: sugar phosphate isomerase/epimerase family protein [Chloroflexota bacterium]|nr:sugar phosphate isomerase/epimerase family protein [Chloroflexota bacterium]